MLNLTSLCTVTLHGRGVDPATGLGTITTSTPYERVRCELVPLSAKEQMDRYGEGGPVDTSRTYAALVLPSWVPVLSLTDHTVTVDGDGPWTLEAVSVLPAWTRYLVSRSY